MYCPQSDDYHSDDFEADEDEDLQNDASAYGTMIQQNVVIQNNYINHQQACSVMLDGVVGPVPIKLCITRDMDAQDPSLVDVIAKKALQIIGYVPAYGFNHTSTCEQLY